MSSSVEKKKRNSLFFVLLQGATNSALILASCQCYTHKVLEWVQTDQILRSRGRTFSKTSVCPVQHRAGGDLPFVALSLGKLREEIQASRNLEKYRSVMFCHSSRQKGKLSSLCVVPQRHQTVFFAVR